ncbi:LADA_0E10308g1_1 [Lachancea dasiensis]|uniref:LADA_0E10308g1_1 n=1 Tax=Lachancea dasiensis TaxID=1072105 RepID=A0A1G4JEM8_9SACH|nr:LADA_0E10308g1_1 [Lachancea dasiensis]
MRYRVVQKELRLLLLGQRRREPIGSMGDGTGGRKENDNPSPVKRRSLSNYLLNIQKRRQQLEESAKAQPEISSKAPLNESIKSNSETDEAEETGAGRNPNNASITVNIKTPHDISPNEQQHALPTNTDWALKSLGSSQAERSSVAESKHGIVKSRSEDETQAPQNVARCDIEQPGSPPHSKLGTAVDLQPIERPPPVKIHEATNGQPERLSTTSLNTQNNVIEREERVKAKNDDKRKASNQAELLKSFSPNVTKESDVGTVLNQSQEDESELSEVESDAPTEPASPPKPRLGRLVRGDQLRSSPSRTVPHIPPTHSDESELSDLEDLNQPPISSSILHGDSPTHRSIVTLNSSPARLLKKSPKHMKSYVAVRKPQNIKKSGVHRDAGGRTKLQISCDKGKFDSAKKLIEEGYDVNDQDNAGNSSLHEAALNGHYDIVKLLLENGANVNIQSFEPIKDTPLIDAAANGHLDVVKILLKYNADPTIVNSKGLTAIESIEEDSDLDDDDLETVRSLKSELRRAARRLNSDDERRQRSSSANRHSDGDRSSSNVRLGDEFYWSDITSKVGREKLLRSSREGKLPYVGAYLENGGRVDLKSFLEAVKFGHEDIASLFLAFGAQTSMATRDGQTPLMVALGRGHTGTVKLLLEAGADPTARDKSGKSVLSYAQSSELGLASKGEIELIQNALEKHQPKAFAQTFWHDDEDNQAKDVSSSPQPLVPQKRTEVLDRDLGRESTSKLTPQELNSSRASSPAPVSSFFSSAPAKKPKLEASLSPGAVDTAFEVQRSQNGTPANSTTPRPAETAQEKEARLKAEEEYRLKRLSTKKRKEQELLNKLADDEKKRAEERDRKDAERLRRLQDEKAREAEKEAIERIRDEIDRRHLIRAQYPLGLRLVNFQTTDDLNSFLPVYYSVINTKRYVMDMHMCVLLKDVNFVARCSGGIIISAAHKLQMWNIYKFIFLLGGRGVTKSQVQRDLDALSFQSRAEFEAQERERFISLPLHWVPWDEIEFPENLVPSKGALEAQMVELSMWSERAPGAAPSQSTTAVGAVARLGTSEPRDQGTLDHTTRTVLSSVSKELPVRFRNRPSINGALKGPLPAW